MNGKILPIVLAIILHDDAICLLRRTKEPYLQHWGLPGGKMHFGETVPQAALREAMEETALPLTFERYGPTATEIIRTADNIPEAHFLMMTAVLRAEHRTFTVSSEGDLDWFPLSHFLDGSINEPTIPSDRIMAQQAFKEGPPIPIHFEVRHDSHPERYVLLETDLSGSHPFPVDNSPRSV